MRARKIRRKFLPIIGGTEQSHQLPLCKKFISVFHHLMRSANQIQIVSVFCQKTRKKRDTNLFKNDETTSCPKVQLTPLQKKNVKQASKIKEEQQTRNQEQTKHTNSNKSDKRTQNRYQRLKNKQENENTNSINHSLIDDMHKTRKQEGQNEIKLEKHTK